MQINRIDSQTSFRSMFVGKTIEDRLARPNCSKNFVDRFEKIKDVVKINGFAEKENVDIILNTDKEGKFFATISSKKEGVPMHPHNKCYISQNQKTIDKFVYWLEAWNDNYDPEMLDMINKIVKGEKPAF